MKINKLLQTLLLAPASLGLMAPLAHAADLNLAGMSPYLSGTEQVSSIRQFGDLQPTDWSYQALSALIERYGCVAGFASGTYRGNQPMSRWEAAALLNACVDRIGETTDTLKRLLQDFEKELTVLRGRVDALEAKAGQVDAMTFSTTTKLKGIANFVLGANRFTGTNSGSQFVDLASSMESLMAFNTPGFYQVRFGATVLEYDLQLRFDTSFTGQDLLRTVLRGGNSGGFNGSAFSSFGLLTTLEAFYEQPLGDNSMGMFQLFYNFPLGKELSVSVGPLVRNDDPGMLGLWPSVYPADTVLDFFTYAGVPGTYNTNGLGGGGGFVYSPQWAKGLTISQSYVSAEGSSFNNNVGFFTNASSGDPGLGGMFTNGAGSAAITQLGYVSDNTPLIGGSYGIAVAYTYSQNLGLPSGTPLAMIFSDYNSYASGYSSSNNVGVSGYWQPSQSGLIPSISWGVGTGSYNIQSGDQYIPDAVYAATTRGGMFTGTAGVTIASWYTGLQWDDALIRGNTLGMAVGQAPYLTQLGSNGADTPRGIVDSLTGTGSTGANDANYMWEWWYKVQVSDNITLTPALFYISNLSGQLGTLNQSGSTGTASFNVLGGLLKTTIQF
jgi:hypothetical protein